MSSKSRDNKLIHGIRLSVCNKVKQVILPENLLVDNCDLVSLEKLYRKKGTGELSRHCDWELDDFIVSVYFR